MDSSGSAWAVEGFNLSFALKKLVQLDPILRKLNCKPLSYSISITEIGKFAVTGLMGKYYPILGGE